MDSFEKKDLNKIRLELIEPEFVLGVGEVLTFGAIKYDDDNWKKASKEDIKRFKGAMLRHIYAYLDGERFDAETDISHLYHVACNCMFIDYFDRLAIIEDKIISDAVASNVEMDRKWINNVSK